MAGFTYHIKLPAHRFWQQTCLKANYLPQLPQSHSHTICYTVSTHRSLLLHIHHFKRSICIHTTVVVSSEPSTAQYRPFYTALRGHSLLWRRTVSFSEVAAFPSIATMYCTFSSYWVKIYTLSYYTGTNHLAPAKWKSLQQCTSKNQNISTANPQSLQTVTQS